MIKTILLAALALLPLTASANDTSWIRGKKVIEILQYGEIKNRYDNKIVILLDDVLYVCVTTLERAGCKLLVDGR